MIEFTTCETPLGRIHLAMNGAALTHVQIQSELHPSEPPSDWLRSDARLNSVAQEMAAYFAGELQQFTIPVDPQGTAFQRKTWAVLREVPYGETRTYGELASAVGSPGASRAVGLAMRTNPLPLILPCHRVIGSGGTLTGYAHGVPMKRSLLQFERANCANGGGRSWHEIHSGIETLGTADLFQV